MSWNQKKIDQIYKEIQEKACRDETFRDLLQTDPNKAISQLAGEDLPAGLKINFVEKTSGYDATFVLPDLMSDEINDDDLDKVAGGISFLAVASACAAALSIGPCPADACAANAGINK